MKESEGAPDQPKKFNMKLQRRKIHILLNTLHHLKAVQMTESAIGSPT